jgi:hypothetical protein
MMRWGRSIKIKFRLLRFVGEESGQSLIIVAGAIITLIAIIGLGVDLGLAFVERVRLARAMDAAALAGAQELPAELPAHLRALEYLEENGYDTREACVETWGIEVPGTVNKGECAGSGRSTNIYIDTESYREAGVLNTANRINVKAQQDVRMAFIRVLKRFDHVTVGASATAENIEDLDIALVYDRSGSMQEDTRCYGCWELADGGEYPEGSTYPLPFTIVPTTGLAIHCGPSEPLSYGGNWYVTIEAEHYSRYLTEADYHRDWTEWPKIWWAMNRQAGVNASGPDERGAFMKVGPHSEGAIHYSSVVQPPDYWTTPRLDYDFTVPTAGAYYVWMRAQGGRDGWENDILRRQVFVGLNGAPMATGQTDKFGPYGTEGGAAWPDSWRWSRVLTIPNLGANTPYTLNFWASGPGFSLDKIVITNNPNPGLGNRAPLNWTHRNVPNGGPTETHGRTGWACLGADDPRFAPVHPTTGELDDLYDDAQPIRAAKEAAKRFVRRLDPELDQISYVWYSTESEIRRELYCLKQYGGCEDFEIVANAIESTRAGGRTNISDAIWDGLRVLTTGAEGNTAFLPPKTPGKMHYGRPRAAHIMILMTDGQANEYPRLPSGYGNCYSDDLWEDQPDESLDQRRARECVVWFGLKARDQGVVIYTIGLGAQADNELLAHVASVTGGGYYFAPSGAELDAIFESLYEQIFLRLTD